MTLCVCPEMSLPGFAHLVPIDCERLKKGETLMAWRLRRYGPEVMKNEEETQEAVLKDWVVPDWVVPLIPLILLPRRPERRIRPRRPMA